MQRTMTKYEFVERMMEDLEKKNSHAIVEESEWEHEKMHNDIVSQGGGIVNG